LSLVYLFKHKENELKKDLNNSLKIILKEEENGK
jgi:hypothetical protein